MLVGDEIANLAQFLDCRGVIDTRQVTLQSLKSILGDKDYGPIDAVVLEDLQDRIFAIAESTLRAGIFASGRPAALALNAIVCLAMMGDKRMSLCMQWAEETGASWLVQMMRRDVGKIRGVQ